MPPTTPCSFGDVVLVPFPFTDASATKKRPAVVVSSAAYNAQRPDLVLMPITSQIRPALGLGEVLVGDWKAAGLLMPSVVKPLVATIQKTLVIRTLGRLSAQDLAAVQAELRKILAP